MPNPNYSLREENIGHESDACEDCHEKHIHNFDVADNARKYPDDFPCCVWELDKLVQKGLACPIHPWGSYGFLEGNKDFWCDHCAESNPKYSGGLVKEEVNL